MEGKKNYRKIEEKEKKIGRKEKKAWKEKDGVKLKEGTLAKQGKEKMKTNK